MRINHRDSYWIIRFFIMVIFLLHVFFIITKLILLRCIISIEFHNKTLFLLFFIEDLCLLLKEYVERAVFVTIILMASFLNQQRIYLQFLAKLPWSFLHKIKTPIINPTVPDVKSCQNYLRFLLYPAGSWTVFHQMYVKVKNTNLKYQISKR